jgi:hypothetical protein
MDILRDPIWQFVGAILGLIAIIISIMLFWIQHQRKSLSFEIIHNAYLVRSKDEVKDKLKILYEKKPIENLLLLIVRLVNTGNVPILASD